MNYGRFYFYGLTILISFQLPAQSTTKADEIFAVAEQMPRFPGCENIIGGTKQKEYCSQERMLDYIYSNLVYPESAKRDRIEGIVVVQFVVDDTGFVDEVQVLKDIGAGCGEAVKVIVESMNSMNDKWRPGYQREKPIFAYYRIPIKFKIGRKPKFRSKDMVEYNALFPGCAVSHSPFRKQDCTTEKIDMFILENLKYPKEARKAGFEANVWVSFVIDELGEIYEIELSDEDPGYGLGEAAMVVIEDMADEVVFRPALTNNKAVSSQWEVMVPFKL